MTTITPKRAVLANLGEPPDPRKPMYRNNPLLWQEHAVRWMANLASTLERYSQINDRPTANAYALSNVTVTRTLDANSTTTDELADVICTVIQDLQSKGHLP